MGSKVFTGFIFTLFALAQVKAASVKGRLVNELSAAVSNQALFLGNGTQTSTNTNGEFVFNNVLKGNYELKTEVGGQLVTLRYFEVENTDVTLGDVTLLKTIQLKEAEIRDVSINKGIERMPDVKDNVIYAGKKTEVVKLSTASANLAQNNSRQIFAKVPGIQVWESDGSGVQMGVASRGLSPNRMWEFNTRQNGYDIAADPFGYPEAYFTPSVESLDRIEVIRGAASLQYGPQFGGVINYIKKRSVSGKKFGVESAQTFGSYGMFSTFNAVGGTIKKFSYYANINYRRSDGWRKNNEYNTWNGYVNLGYQITKKINVSFEYSRMDQLVQQPGGLTDSMFKADAQQSIRTRNWFDLVWNIAALNIDYQINDNNKLNVKAFGLSGDRSSIGFLSAINTPDAITAGQYANRTIDVDKYRNYGVEVRHLFSYQIKNQKQNLAVGVRYYNGATDRIQNTKGNRGTDYDLAAESSNLNRDLKFETQNMAFFAEHLFNITKRWSVTPGFRLESLNNTSKGIFNGNANDRKSERQFGLLGIGSQYKVTSNTNVYANYTQCYRPVLFSDITASTTDSINQNLKDAKGYNVDLGYRGSVGKYLSFDASVFYLNYENRVGTYSVNGKNYRTNIGTSVSKGVEAYVEFSPTELMKTTKGGQVSLFASLAFIDAKYVSWNDPDQTKNLKNKRVENAPNQIHRLGITYKYKWITTTWQHSYVGDAYADAMNTENANAAATVGKIPSYQVADWSFKAQVFKLFNVNAGINNVFNKSYFTRRGGGYPGPGLLPAEGRIWYVGVGVKF